jgi:hypothetical protein
MIYCDLKMILFEHEQGLASRICIELKLKLVIFINNEK